MSEFKAGDEVAVLSGGTWRNNISKATIFKVYKTGNFILKAGGRQYGSNGHVTGSGWSGGYVEHWSEKHDAILAKIEIQRRAVKLSDDIAKKYKSLSIDVIIKIEDLLTADGIDV